MSMKSTPSSGSAPQDGDRRGRGPRAAPQMPSPVMRIAPKPRRVTSRSPPILNVPDAAAEMVAMSSTLPEGRVRDPSERRIGVLALVRRHGPAHHPPGERLRRAVATDVDAHPQTLRPAQLAARRHLGLGLVLPPAARAPPRGRLRVVNTRSSRSSASSASSSVAWRASPSGRRGGRSRRTATPWAARSLRGGERRDQLVHAPSRRVRSSWCVICANSRWAAVLDGSIVAVKRSTPLLHAPSRASQRPSARAHAAALQVVGDDDRQLGAQRVLRVADPAPDADDRGRGGAPGTATKRVVVDEVDLGQIASAPSAVRLAAWGRGSAGRPSAPTGGPARRRARPCRPGVMGADQRARGVRAQGRSVMRRTRYAPSGSL